MKSEQAELFGAAAPVLPEGFVYQPEFLSEEEESALLAEIARLTDTVLDLLHSLVDTAPELELD